ncbi:MAG: SIS domain-containing protein [Candidatus Omnitrophica bacterium]|nr:SIS domain-containing protein [Candidatus Omnitrophota bacterium]MBU1128769.1 SIS domain-containing protein [Candidatus Omnitrophota bacterium]MBU1656544.1 SIS domain-containing protein [Candidatus Omnitrophota bacterium]MBU1785230.1 SIS domain-containing protein [Candidatus Omnitrophota bacterium]MBU1851238.1 SIS domain-containing protein [Candidatus Omnitrophota bacterium]
MDAVDKVKEIFKESIRVKTEFLGNTEGVAVIVKAAGVISDCLKKGGKVMVFGNGGSAADSQHMAAELMVRFEKDRKALPCIALNANTSNITAAANDYAFEKIFSRQIDALARPNDVVVAISTSGNSPNILDAVRTAQEKGITVIGLTGRSGGKLSRLSDIPVIVRENNTARVQETHILIIHALCKLVEEAI